MTCASKGKTIVRNTCELRYCLSSRFHTFLLFFFFTVSVLVFFIFIYFPHFFFFLLPLHTFIPMVCS